MQARHRQAHPGGSPRCGASGQANLPQVRKQRPCGHAHMPNLGHAQAAGGRVLGEPSPPVAVEPCRRGVVGTSLQSTPLRRPPCPVTRPGRAALLAKGSISGWEGRQQVLPDGGPAGCPIEGHLEKGNGGVGARGVRTPGLCGVKARASLLLGPPAVLILQWSCYI